MNSVPSLVFNMFLLMCGVLSGGGSVCVCAGLRLASLGCPSLPDVWVMSMFIHTRLSGLSLHLCSPHFPELTGFSELMRN